MEKEVLKRIFEFLKEKENHNLPFLWKLVNNEPLTEDELNVKGNLDLSNSDITSLPEGLQFIGSLVLAWTNITSLPEDLKVGGDLYLDNSLIKSIPKGLMVGRDLDISFTHIESLPRGLKVGGDLYLNDSDLHRSIDYNDSSELESIIKKMVEPGFIKGNVIFDEEGEDWL
jgi:hypothetical protein